MRTAQQKDLLAEAEAFSERTLSDKTSRYHTCQQQSVGRYQRWIHQSLYRPSSVSATLSHTIQAGSGFYQLPINVCSSYGLDET